MLYKALIPAIISNADCEVLAGRSGLRSCQLIWALDLLARKTTNNKRDSGHFYPLSSVILRNTLGSKTYRRILDALISEGWVDRDDSYSYAPQNAFSKSYRFSAKVALNGRYHIVEVPENPHKPDYNLQLKVSSELPDDDQKLLDDMSKTLEEIRVKPSFWSRVRELKSTENALHEKNYGNVRKNKKKLKDEMKRHNHVMRSLESAEQTAIAVNNFRADGSCGRITMDQFGRIHSPLSRFPKRFRGHLELHGEGLASADIKNSQPAIWASLFSKTASGKLTAKDWAAKLFQAAVACRNKKTRLNIVQEPELVIRKQQQQAAVEYIRSLNEKKLEEWTEEDKENRKQAMIAYHVGKKTYTLETLKEAVEQQAKELVEVLRDSKNAESIKDWSAAASSGLMYEELTRLGGPEAERLLKEDRTEAKQSILKVLYERPKSGVTAEEWRKKVAEAKVWKVRATRQCRAAMAEKYPAIEQALSIVKKLTYGAAAAIAQRAESETMRQILKKTGGMSGHDAIIVKASKSEVTAKVLKAGLAEAEIEAKVLEENYRGNRSCKQSKSELETDRNGKVQTNRSKNWKPRSQALSQISKVKQTKSRSLTNTQVELPYVAHSVANFHFQPINTQLPRGPPGNSARITPALHLRIGSQPAKMNPVCLFPPWNQKDLCDASYRCVLLGYR